jgi:hypothetical protein
MMKSDDVVKASLGGSLVIGSYKVA